MKILPAEFDGQSIRRVYDEVTGVWWFSIIDVVPVLTQQPDDLTARKYWNQLKRRLNKEGSQLVTNCHQLKMITADGKHKLTDYWRGHDIKEGSEFAILTNIIHQEWAG